MIVIPAMKRMSVALLASAVVLGVNACATGPPKSAAQRQIDKETAERVEAALHADKDLYANHITVSADRGVVHLSGYVWEPPDLLEAERIASLQEGVTGVVDDLELQRNGSGNSQVAR